MNAPTPIPSLREVRYAAAMRLAAAAPDLLDALQALSDAFPAKSTHPAVQAARAAIKKAKGLT